MMIENRNELSKAIDKYLIPTKIEKKSNAEVSTPYQLRKEMLDRIPADFWKTRHKVFEPCSGKGGFLIDIIDRFMNGLKHVIECEKERYKIIVEECLYFSDINESNIFICKLLIDPYNKYKLNCYLGDTLKMDIKEKFSAVVGNPPYNLNGGYTIWQDFIKVSLNKFLENGGYLVFVNPSGWRKPTSKASRYHGLYELMTRENQLLYLSIHNTKDGVKTFNCGTRYDWYLVKKAKKYTTTIIKDENNKVHDLDISKFKFIPNYNFQIIKKILANDDDERCEVIFSNSSYDPRGSWMSRVKEGEFKYPCIHSTPRKGVRYTYSKVNDRGHFGISKVIFGNTGINNSIIDINGEYGLTQHGIGIKIYDMEGGINIKKAIESEKFKDLIVSCSWSNYMIDFRLFKHFKKDFWKEFI